MSKCLNQRLAWFITLLAIGGCTTTIIPPSNPPNPTTVIVTDYGRHSSLLIPDSRGGLIEYAFGDWDWFALGHTNAIVAIHALIHSPQSTLGRRWVFTSADSPNAPELIGTRQIERVTVAGIRVAALRAQLDGEYIRHIDSAIFQPDGRLYFVRCDEPYDLFHNCNHETAKWLEELGARIEGTAILSHFRVRPLTAAPANKKQAPHVHAIASTQILCLCFHEKWRRRDESRER